MAIIRRTHKECVLKTPDTHRARVTGPVPVALQRCWAERAGALSRESQETPRLQTAPGLGRPRASLLTKEMPMTEGHHFPIKAANASLEIASVGRAGRQGVPLAGAHFAAGCGSPAMGTMGTEDAHTLGPNILSRTEPDGHRTVAACSGDGDVKPGCTSLGWAGGREGRSPLTHSFAQYHPSTHRVPVSQALGKHPELNGLKNGGGKKRELREGVSIVGAGVGGRLQWWGRGRPGEGTGRAKACRQEPTSSIRNSRMAGVAAADQGRKVLSERLGEAGNGGLAGQHEGATPTHSIFSLELGS